MANVALVVFCISQLNGVYVKPTAVVFGTFFRKFTLFLCDLALFLGCFFGLFGSDASNGLLVLGVFCLDTRPNVLEAVKEAAKAVLLSL